MAITIKIINDSTEETLRSITISNAKIKALKYLSVGYTGVLDHFIEIVSKRIERSIRTMRKDFNEILINEETLPPKDDDAFVELVTARSDYKDREARESELP